MVVRFRCGCSWNTTSTCTDFRSAGILPAERRHPAGFTETFRGGPLPASFFWSAATCRRFLLVGLREGDRQKRRQVGALQDLAHSFYDAPHPFHAFPQTIQRRRVGNSYESIGAKARTV